MRVLVTGNEGYIGGEMVRVLSEGGHDVWGLDCGYYEPCLLETPVAPVDERRRLRKDLRDARLADLAGFDAVIHLAALCNDPIGGLNAEWTHDINHRAAVRLARLAKESGVARFIFSSSCSVYGDSGVDEELTESSTPRPLTAYALSKARSETDIAAMADADFSPVCLRNGSVYGLAPHFRADIVLNNLACWAVTTGKVTMFTDGTPWRPLAHVEDVCAVFARVLTAPREVIHNQVFNVGAPGENYQVGTLARIVCDSVEGSEVERVPHATGDSRNYRVSFDKLRNAFPDLRLRWNAAAGAAQVRDGLVAAGITTSDFQGPRFSRLARLEQLIRSSEVDASLRMQRAALPVTP